jgi:hypothetical protein
MIPRLSNLIKFERSYGLFQNGVTILGDKIGWQGHNLSQTCSNSIILVSLIFLDSEEINNTKIIEFDQVWDKLWPCHHFNSALSSIPHFRRNIYNLKMVSIMKSIQNVWKWKTLDFSIGFKIRLIDFLKITLLLYFQIFNFLSIYL